MTPILTAESISVSFGGVRALDDVSLLLPPAGIVGLIGPNGAGKSTLFSVISGLKRPDRGTVRIDGSDVTKMAPARRARLGMARTFQRPELFGELTVREHLVLARRTRLGGSPFWRDLLGIGSRSSSDENHEAEGILAMLGLEALAGQPAAALALGTARLLEVARAVATNPRFVLLDEPSSGLDAAETTQLVTVLRRLREERHLALLLVEHDVGLVLGLADNVTVLDFGRVIATGTPDDIRRDQGVQRAYLGTSP